MALNLGYIQTSQAAGKPNKACAAHDLTGASSKQGDPLSQIRTPEPNY